MTETDVLNALITINAKKAVPLKKDIVLKEVNDWLASKRRADMVTGQNYFNCKTDIQKKVRTGVDGVELEHRSNQKIETTLFRSIVMQKIGYLLGKVPTISSTNKEYADAVSALMNPKFWKEIRKCSVDAITKGTGWAKISFGKDGEICIKSVDALELIPISIDYDSGKLDQIIRTYEVEIINPADGKREKVRKIEHWTTERVEYYEIDGDKIIPDVQAIEEKGNGHFLMNGNPQVWERVPFIPIQYNDSGQLLINCLKSNIDNLNEQASINADMLIDFPKAVMVLMGYGGEDADEFLYQVRQLGVAKVGEGGGLDTIQIAPNTEGTEKELKRSRLEILNGGAGVDLFDTATFGTSSGVALKYKFAILDIDCNIFEPEIAIAVENIAWFFVRYLKAMGVGDFTEDNLEIILNRDIIIAETDVIAACLNSTTFMPLQEVQENHPWFTSNTSRLWEEQKAAERTELKERFALENEE